MISDESVTGADGSAAASAGGTADPSGYSGDDPDRSDGELLDVGPDDLSTEPGTTEIPTDDDLRLSVGDLDQSSEEAVAEAVELAQRLERERDEYLDALRRLKADFENYKRRVSTQQEEQRAQASLALVRELLPVLDAFDAAVSHGSEEVQPLRDQLIQTLEKQGMEVQSEAGVPFDPNVHEAVMHEEGDGEPVVSEVMRTGYLWNGRVARAAMVRVRG